MSPLVRFLKRLCGRAAGEEGPRAPRAERLEPRILYSADPLSLYASSVEVRMLEPEAASTPLELVFIDSRVTDADAWRAALTGSADEGRRFEVVQIDGTRSGLAQISEQLRGRQDVAAVHIVSHGTQGTLLLGSQVVDSATLEREAASLMRWQSALGEQADILLYGCNVGEGEPGALFIETLARLSGADVAASTNATGGAAHGGDTTLEARTGLIEAATPALSALRTDASLLATYVVINTSDSGAGSLRQAITDANNNPGADIISFNIAGTGVHTINVGSTLLVNGAVTIDATTDDSFAANGNRPAIILDGNNAFSGDGLVLGANADGSVIRGFVIRDFSGAGISVLSGSDGNTIAGNYIGRLGATGVDAGAAEANTGAGINVQGSNNTIGGLTAAARNVIAGNADGIYLQGGSGNTILGNYIGTNATGLLALGNVDRGVQIESGANNTTVGGTGAWARNVISGNGTDGIIISDGAIPGTGTTGTIIEGNYIGVGADGVTAIGNAVDGVRITTESGHRIGGTAAGAGNVIAHNTRDGVQVSNSTAVNIAILGNSIYSNGSDGIDLAGNGVTANDVGDGDSGANGLQNFPVLTSANSNVAGTTIAGSFNSNANTTYRIEFFANRPTIADSPNGEGERYLGAITVTTDGSGNATINTTLASVWVNSGDRITATATVDLGGGNFGSTSEFAVNVTATSTGIIVVDTTSDAIGGTTTSIANLGNARGADGRISLREAIAAANNTANGATPDRIVFAIPVTDANHFYYRDNGVGGTFSAAVATTLADAAITDFDADYIAGTARSWYRIDLGVTNLDVTQAVITDGSTQAGFDAARGPIIEINAAGVSSGDTNGIALTTGASTIRALVINRAGDDAVEIDVGAGGSTVVGSFLGTDVSGLLTTYGNQYGITIKSDGNTIGGTDLADRNVIAGNSTSGLSFGIGFWQDADNNIVQGNYIGVGADGITAMGNRQGITFQNTPDNNLIGGTLTGAGNIIANHSQNGIDVIAGTGNAFVGNTIFSNGLLGINLATAGVTGNDGGDGDSGPNGLQNFPVLTSANSNSAGTTIAGSLNSNASTTYRIEFFASRPAVADSPNGEGERYLGAITVITDGSGNATINTTLANVWVNSGDRISATATVDLGGGNYGSTSEFAVNATATSTGIVVVDTTVDNLDATNTTSIANLGNNRGADGRISLREAIIATNNTANGGTPDRIVFAIAAPLVGGVHTITLTYDGADAGTVPDELPVITQALIIDGWSEPDYAGTPVIELSGNNVGTLVRGLVLGAGSGGSAISGLTINRFTGTGIEISGSSNHTIQGNWIGLNAAGAAAAANGVNGIYAANSAGNLIGGTTAAARNVISGNATQGIFFSNVDNSTISGNYIGTNAAGTGDVTGTGPVTAQSGVLLSAGSSDNVIGGTSAAARNVISGNNHYGFEVLDASSQNNLVQGNYIGTTASGLAALGNTNGGVSFWGAGSGNVLGGGATGARNIISGNLGRGVLVGNASTGATIQGNYIGVGADGITLLGNTSHGIRVEGASTGTRIGTNADGTNDAAERNVISGNNSYGVYVVGSGTNGTVVAGNVVGLAADGDTIVANTSHGVGVASSAGAVMVGGSTSVSRNVIAGNAGFGVYIGGGTSGSSVLSNYIGTNAAGTEARANLDGVWIDGSANNIIGQAGAGNLISGNTYYGVVVDAVASTGNVIRANLIGLNAAGTGAVGNGAHGVWVSNGASAVSIGGSAVGQGNSIAYNSGNGIHVSAGSGVSILGNSIHSNTSLGINLGPTGVTLNDVGDGDTGANGLQNFPVLGAAATNGTQITITGTFNSTASTTFRVEFFSNAAADGSGYGQGRTYLGFANVTTDGSGNATINATLGAGVAAGEFISATATSNTTNETSEFAQCIVATLPNAAPTLNATALNPTFTEAAGLGTQAAAVSVFSGAAVSTIEPGQLITGLVFTVGGLLNGTNEVIVVDGRTITLGGNSSGTTVTNGLTYSATVSGGTATVSLSLGSLSAAAAQTLVNGITYQNTNTDNPSPGNRVFTLTQISDDGGTANGGVDTRAYAIGSTVNVVAVNDLPTGAPVITGTAAEDQVLTANTATIADAEGLGAFGYQWQRNGVNIGGATAATYTLGDADVGTSVRVIVSYTDARGTSESLTSAAVGPIANVNDVPTGAPVVTGTATEDQVLTANTAAIADADGLGAFSYQWQRNGVNIGGATSSTYTLGDADVGTNIRVVVSYTDAQGTAESLTSAAVGPVANVNDVPTGVPAVTGTPTEDQVLTANTATIADADGLGAFSYQWQRNGVNIGGATASTYTLGDVDVGNSIRVIVAYTDARGTAESLTSAAVGPIANINDAPTGAPVVTGTPTEDQVLTANTGSIADADGLSAFSYQWQRNGVNIGGASASTYTPGDADVGASIRVVVSYTDAHGTAESLTSAAVGPIVNVNDTPIGAPVVTGAPTEDQVLTANTGSIADADGLGAFSYQWQRNGVNIGGATSSTYTLGDADVGASIRVVVAYTDGNGTAESLTSAAVGPVANVNDVPTGAPVVTGTATEDQVLTANTAAIADADGLGALSYQWQRNGVNIGGATASTYTLGDVDVGNSIRVIVAYTDARGTAESLTSAAVGPIANVNDVPTGAPVVDGTQTEDQILTANTASIADADGLGAFSYQWQRNGVDIGGATSSTYTLGDADVGASIRVVVAYTDGSGTAESLTSAAVGPVANVNDVPTGAPVVDGTQTEDQILTANTASIADADGLGAFSYQWQRNGVNVGGATASTYTLGDADVGASIRVVVAYTDGNGTAESVTSAAVGPIANVNDVPTGAPVVDGTPTEDQVLTANTASIADADGLGAFSYQWQRNGVNIGAATASTYTLGDADVGASIRVVVAYTDGNGTAESLTSAAVGPIANVNDVPTGAPVVDGTPTEDQILTANTASIADADGLGAFSYQWQRNGVNVGGATASTYTLGDADVGTNIRVVVSYTDAHGMAESLTSAAVGPVANVNDVPTGALVVTGTPTEDQVLTANTASIADADGLGAFSYQWQRNGVDIGGATSSTYTLGDADVGTNIRVVVSYTDAHGTAESLTSAAVGPVANVNDVPTGAPVVTGTPTEDQLLNANTVSIADADGLGVFSYQWQRNGVDIGGATSNTYTLSDADVGTNINVVVSYTDALGTAESLTSAAVGPVANVNDVPTGAPVVTGTPTEDQVLTVDTASITDADGLGAFSYQWQRNGVNIVGATASTYTLGDADVGASIRVVVAYTDGRGTAESLTSAAVGPVANVNDAPTGNVNVDNVAPTQGQVLTASNTLVDADGLGAISYQWQRGGMDVAGASGTTYTATQADVGSVLRVVATYTDGQGTVESVASASTAAVANVNDAPTGAPIVTGMPAEYQTLTADTGTIADADGLGTISYQWQRDGIDIAGATSASHVLGAADIGASIRVVVSYTDGQGTAERLTSTAVGPVANVNDPPAGLDSTASMDEDALHVLGRADFGFADPDSGDTLGAVRIDRLPDAGTLLLDGVAVSAGTVVDAAALDAGRLVFAPAPDANGSPYATLDFTVRDAAGLFAAAPARLTLVVAPLPDAPRIDTPAAPATAAVDEGAPAGTLVTVVHATDADLGDTLAYSLDDDAAGRFVIDAQSGRLTVAPAAVLDHESAPTWLVTVRVTDGSGLFATRSIQIHVGDVPQAPATVPGPAAAPVPALVPATVPAFDPAPAPETPAAPPTAAPVSPLPDPGTTRPAQVPEGGRTERALGFRSGPDSGEVAYDRSGDEDAQDHAHVFATGIGTGIGTGTGGAWRRDAEASFNPVASGERAAVGRAVHVGLDMSTPAFEFVAADPEAGPVRSFIDAAGLRRAIDIDLVDDAVSPGAQQRGEDPTGLHFTSADAARAAGVTVTAGFLWWLTRGGGLLTMMLMGIPAWRHMDMLPVLARQLDEEAALGDPDDDDEDGADDHLLPEPGIGEIFAAAGQAPVPTNQLR